MPAATMVVPGRLSTLTGGSIYDRRIVEGLRQRGWSIDVIELDGAFPRPSVDAIDAASRAFGRLPDGTTTIVDGLVFSTLPDAAERHARRLHLVPVVHMPLAEEIGIDAATARRREADERRALAASTVVVVTGPSTARIAADYGVDRDRIVLIEPGVDRVPVARDSGGPSLKLLCIAALTPGKGHDVLLSALARFRNLEWTLTCVGSLLRDPSTAINVQQLLKREDLEARVSLAGELDAASLEECYAAADVFVLATLRETYGMAVAEAVAHGLPAVSTATGAIPQLLRDGAGLVVEPGDVDAFAEALSCVLRERALLDRLREGALRARDRLKPWDDSVERMAAVLESIPLHG